jgi:hypothetical protein
VRLINVGAKADELKAKRILLGVGFLANDPEDVDGIRAYGHEAGSGHLANRARLPACR